MQIVLQSSFSCTIFRACCGFSATGSPDTAVSASGSNNGRLSELPAVFSEVYLHLLYYVSVFVCTVSVSGVWGGGVHVCTRCVSLCVCRCSEYICTEKLCVPEPE